MKIPSKKLLPILFLLLIVCSIRLLRITINTTSFFHPHPSFPPFLSAIFNPNTSTEHSPYISNKLAKQSNPTEEDHTEEESLSLKEYNLLSNIISRRAPCNLLIFGLNSQLLNLSKLNIGGTTVFLENDAENFMDLISETNSSHFYKVQYHGKASEAFELLKFARGHNACRLEAGQLHISHCKLALTQLPKTVYRKRWDVVVIDGPRGDQPETPGRMGTIYTVGILARARNTTTDVLVHDANRMIEKWYSWEFLCQENLISSKGKLWHFQINDGLSSGRFCHDAFYF